MAPAAAQGEPSVKQLSTLAGLQQIRRYKPTSSPMATHPTEPMRQLCIWQQNVNRSLEAQLDLLHSTAPSQYHIVAIQEAYIDHLGNSRAYPHWHTVYPPGHLDNPRSTRSLLLISKPSLTTNSWTQLLVGSPDITVIQLNSNLGKIQVYNIYNDRTCCECRIILVCISIKCTK